MKKYKLLIDLHLIDHQYKKDDIFVEYTEDEYELYSHKGEFAPIQAYFVELNPLIFQKI